MGSRVLKHVYAREYCMKIGYFYPSSLKVEHQDDKLLPPPHGAMVIEPEEFPSEESVVLNFSILGINFGDLFAVHVAQYFDGKKQASPIKEYTPFREKNFISKGGKIAQRFSVIEPVKVEEEGIYTLKMFLFDHHITDDDVDTNLAIDSTECSIFIAQEWK